MQSDLPLLKENFWSKIWNRRRDLIEVYTIMKGIDRVNTLFFFPRVGESRIRGLRFKVRGERT